MVSKVLLETSRTRRESFVCTDKDVTLHTYKCHSPPFISGIYRSTVKFNTKWSEYSIIFCAGNLEEPKVLASTHGECSGSRSTRRVGTTCGWVYKQVNIIYSSRYKNGTLVFPAPTHTRTHTHTHTYAWMYVQVYGPCKNGESQELKKRKFRPPSEFS